MSFAEIQNKNCTDCNFSATCSNVCQMNVERKPKENMLMIVGDFPSKSDAANDTIMQSGKEAMLWKVIDDAIIGSKRFQFYPTYAVKCRPANGENPGKEEIQACSQYLMQEIQLLKPKAILLLGNAAMQAFGLKGVITKIRGGVIDFEVDGFTTKLIPTYSPMYVLNAPNAIDSFARDINKAYLMATGSKENIVEHSKIVMVDTMEKVDQLIEYCLQTKEVCFDYETTTLDEELGVQAPGFKATLLSISFQHGSSYTIPLEHFESPFSKKEVKLIIKKFSLNIFQNPEIRKIAHNIKFDMWVTAFYGFPVFKGRLDDTMLMHHLLDETIRHGLKVVVPIYYPKMLGYDDEVNRYRWEEVPLNILAPYGGTDTDYTFRICTIQEGKLLQDPKLYKIYRHEVMAALKPLFEAEVTGMSVDRELILKNTDRATELLEDQKKTLLAFPQVKKFEAHTRAIMTAMVISGYEDKLEGKKGKNLTNLQEKIAAVKSGAKVVYEGLDVMSPDQLGDFFYSKYGLGYKKPYDRKKRAYSQSTDARIIKRYEDHTGFIRELLISRTIATNMNTFMIGLLAQADAKDKVHTSFLLHGTGTGRLSSKKPNIQNISTHAKIDDPKVKEVVGMIKRGFNVPEGYTLMSLDFSQAELRIIAELAGEQTMIDAYNSGADLHALTAANLTGLSLEEFYQLPEDEQSSRRSKAKAANFGLIYGQEALGFMEYAEVNYGVKMSLLESTKIRKQFFTTYPKLEDYHATYIAKGRKFGYVRTLLGRKRHCPNITNANEYIRAQDEREAINMPVQGTCGEMTIFAIAVLYHRLPKSVLLVNTVHDSILYYVPNHLVPYVAEVAKYTAENLPTKLFFGKQLEKLKLVADVEVSTTCWKELKKYSEADWKEFRESEIDSYYTHIENKKAKKAA